MLENDEKPAQNQSRLEAIKALGTTLLKTLAVASPLILVDASRKAYGNTPIAISTLDLLNFSLKVESYLIAFYEFAINDNFPDGGKGAFASLSSTEQAGLKLIHQDHVNHASFLKTFFKDTTLRTPFDPSVLTFDFTATKSATSKTFPDLSTNGATFLLVAQILEDIAVRSYKGQIARFTGLGELTSTIFNIHSVEARHSSYIRKLRIDRKSILKPWLTLTGAGASGVDASTPEGMQENNDITPVYASEDNKSQAQIDIVNINGYMEIDANAATEAFDEPLAQADIQAILNSFTKLDS